MAKTSLIAIGSRLTRFNPSWSFQFSALAKFAVFLAILAVFGTPPARAVVFDFDAGYTAGSVLEGQPNTGTKWDRSPAGTSDGSIAIESNTGVDRQQAAVTQLGTTVGTSNYYCPLTNTDLGGTFNSSSSIVDYSINLALQADPTTSTKEIFSWGVGTPNTAAFEVFANGTVEAENGNGTGGGTLVPLKTTMGGSTNFTALGGVYFTVSGQVNYATKTYTVFIDGIAQTTAGPTATTNFPFVTSTSNSAQVQMTNRNANAVGWMGIAVSHFRYELDPVWSGPINITAGGTYTGNWSNLSNPTVAPVSISTTAAVTITNSRIQGVDNHTGTTPVPALISNLIPGGTGGSTPHSNLTVTNTKFYGMNSSVAGNYPPRFLFMYDPTNLTITNNYMEDTAGSYILNGSAQTFNISNNYVFNIDGRTSNGAGGFNSTGTGGGRDFVQIWACHNFTTCNLQWNKVVEVPNESWVEDTINFYQSGGTAASPVSIADNYIQGSYYYPLATAHNSSTGINCGDGQTGETSTTCSAYINASYNVVVNCMHAGMAFYDGLHGNITNNLIYSTNVVGIDTIARTSGDNGPALAIVDLYSSPAKGEPQGSASPDTFDYLTATSNECGWACNPSTAFSVPSAGDYDYDFSYGSFNDYPAGPTSNTWYSGVPTTATEQGAVNTFYDTVTTDGIVIGTTW